MSGVATGPVGGDVLAVLGGARVVPVVSLQDPAQAVDLAQALLAGVVRVLELELRTPAALEALSRVADAVPDVVVGAGTVLSGEQARAARDAGARFLVSPGTTPRLLDELLGTGVPLLPGVATPSEAMALRERGLRALKLFPAGAVGGVPLLRALAPVLPDLAFCPTGGVDEATAPEHLALPNVACVGGSWLTPPAALAAGDWQRVHDLARRAAAL